MEKSGVVELEPTQGQTDGKKYTAENGAVTFVESIEFAHNSFKNCLQLKWFSVYYIVDWCIMFLLLGLAEGLFGSLGAIPVYQRFGPIQGDPFYMYPIKDSIVPDYLLFISAFIPAVIIFVAIQFLVSRSLHDFHHSVLGFMQTIAATDLITNILKIFCGRPRPFYLTLCNASATVGTVITNSLCDASVSPLKLRDARMSFPSGHSSLMFSTMIFCSLYLSGKMNVMSTFTSKPTFYYSEKRDENDENVSIRRVSKPVHWSQKIIVFISGYFSVHSKAYWKHLLCFSPMLLAFFVAASRTLDYHHNFDDVATGSLLGLAMGTITYFFYFPSLLSSKSHLPKHHYLSVEFSKSSTLVQEQV